MLAVRLCVNCHIAFGRGLVDAAAGRRWRAAGAILCDSDMVSHNGVHPCAVPAPANDRGFL